MITSITMKNIGSYKEETKLETDKRINLIFGFNGTGKTLLSKEFSNNRDNIEWQDKGNIEVLVFNTFYVHDNFLIENEPIKPIFYLGQDQKLKNFIQNKEIEKRSLEQKNKQLLGTLEENNIVGNLEELRADKVKIKESMYEIPWNIYKNNKDQYKQCLFADFKKNKKEDFFIDYEKQDIIKTTITEEEIYEKLYELDKNNIKEISQLQSIDITSINKIINDEIFKRKIIGNENSNIAKYIDELKNQKWVKEGYDLYLHHSLTKCPFCQQETINDNFLNELKKYFSDAYIKDIEYIKKLDNEFHEFKMSISIDSYISNEKIYTNDDYKEKLNTLFKNIENKLQIIEKSILEKIEDPSKTVIIRDINSEISDFNTFIEEINQEIMKSNEEYKNKEDTKKELIKQFWYIKKQELNDEILGKKKEIEDIANKINERNNEVEENKTKIIELDETINKIRLNDTEQAVVNINQQLKNMGITDFIIEPIKNNNINVSENNSILEEYQYILKRNGNVNSAGFHTFSEGEKMIISFLYFIENCKSKIEKDKKIIAVIDDPISSLSSNNLFAVADIIKDLLNDEKYIQFFIMTHNLYFFDEIYRFVKSKENKSEIFSWKTFHIKKYNGVSLIGALNINFITYKYIIFWSMYNEIVFIKKDKYNIVLPNIMRNILEYFCIIIFNNKYTIILNDNKYKGKYKILSRFIDKKSHSDIENEDKNVDVEQAINLFKEFFYHNGFQEHYEVMKKIKYEN